MNMKQNIGMNQLFKRAFKGLDKLGWQLADKPDRIGQNGFAS